MQTTSNLTRKIDRTDAISRILAIGGNTRGVPKLTDHRRLLGGVLRNFFWTPNMTSPNAGLALHVFPSSPQSFSALLSGFQNDYFSMHCDHFSRLSSLPISKSSASVLDDFAQPSHSKCRRALTKGQPSSSSVRRTRCRSNAGDSCRKSTGSQLLGKPK